MAGSANPELSLRSALLLAVTVVTAGALNLSVMSLGTGAASAASLEDATESDQAPTTTRNTIVMVVDVTVPVATTGLAASSRAAVTPARASRPATTGAQTVAPAPTTSPPAAPVAAPTSEPEHRGDDDEHDDDDDEHDDDDDDDDDQDSQRDEGEVAVATEYLYYSFDRVASNLIVADHDKARLEFWSASPEPGWVFKVEENGPRVVKVEFFNAVSGDEAEFVVQREGSTLVVKRER